MAQVKICGIRDEEAFCAALDGGAAYVGFVFFAKSPRHLSFDAAAKLAQLARGKAETVAVTVDADDALLGQIAGRVGVDWVQAHGSENPARVADLKRFARRGVIKALPVAEAGDLGAARAFEGAADMLLFDAKAPAGADRPGGNALAFDWKLLAGQRFSKPWLLSGGLSPGNVNEAIGASGAGLVDVSSGVESAPGIKDPARIAAFLAAARAAG